MGSPQDSATSPAGTPDARAPRWDERLRQVLAVYRLPVGTLEVGDGSLRLQLDTPAGRLGVHVTPRTGDQPSFAATRRYRVSYEGARDLPRPLVRALDLFVRILTKLEGELPEVFAPPPPAMDAPPTTGSAPPADADADTAAAAGPAAAGPAAGDDAAHLAFFREALGDVAGDWQVAAARSDEHIVALTLRGPEGTLELELHHSGDARDVFLCHEGKLGLVIAGAPPGPAAQAVAQRVFARLAPFGFGALASLPTGAAGGFDDADPTTRFYLNARMQTFHRRWRQSEAWWKFYVPQPGEFQVQELLDHVAVLHHATLECKLSAAGHTLPALGLFADAHRTRAGRRNVKIDTYLTEADVTAGRTSALLHDALEQAIAHEGIRHVVLMTTCLPDLIGDNPLPFLRRLERERGVHVHWSSKTMEQRTSVEPLLASVVNSIGFREPRDPRHVVLGGQLAAAAQAELAGYLDELLGLEVRGALLPLVDPERSEHVRSASWFVWVDPRGFSDGIDRSLSSALRVLRPRPPFGLEGVAAWLGELAAATGGTLAESDARAHLATRHGVALAELRGACAGARVALVGDLTDLAMLSTRTAYSSFPPGPLLLELGFPVRYALYEPEGRGGGAAYLEARVPGAEVCPFRTPGELDELLADVSLAWSDFRYDPRLSRRGIRALRDDDFEPGVEGLLRTGRRLLARTRWAPFRGLRGLLRGIEAPA